jgi:hypothetical protein
VTSPLPLVGLVVLRGFDLWPFPLACSLHDFARLVELTYGLSLELALFPLDYLINEFLMLVFMTLLAVLLAHDFCWVHLGLS